MLAGSHLIFANALFSNLTQSHLSAFILGIISHHLADRLPHLDLNLIKSTKYNDFSIFQLPLKLKIILFLEFLIGAIFVYYYFVDIHNINNLIIFYLSLGSLFPDLLRIFFKNKLGKFFPFSIYFNFHKNFHFRLSEKDSRLRVLIIQIIILVIALFFFQLTLIV